jgi:hypothetical protein
MPKHAVMLNHHHHAANLNDGMMPPGLLMQWYRRHIKEITNSYEV